MTTQEDWLDCVCVCVCVLLFLLLLTDLRPNTEYCDFGALDVSLVKDQSKVGINYPKLQKRILRETNLRLHKTIAMQKHRTILGVVKNLPPTNGPSKQKW